MGMKRKLCMSAILLAPLAACSVSKTNVPAHVTLFGSKDRVAALVDRIRVHDPSLHPRLGMTPKGQAKGEFDLVRGGDLDNYADLRDAHGFTVSYGMPHSETRLEIKDPLCFLFSGESNCR